MIEVEERTTRVVREPAADVDVVNRPGRQPRQEDVVEDVVRQLEPGSLREEPVPGRGECLLGAAWVGLSQGIHLLVGERRHGLAGEDVAEGVADIAHARRLATVDRWHPQVPRAALTRLEGRPVAYDEAGEAHVGLVIILVRGILLGRGTDVDVTDALAVHRAAVDRFEALDGGLLGEDVDCAEPCVPEP